MSILRLFTSRGEPVASRFKTIIKHLDMEHNGILYDVYLDENHIGHIKWQNGKYWVEKQTTFSSYKTKMKACLALWRLNYQK